MKLTRNDIIIVGIFISVLFYLYTMPSLEETMVSVDSNELKQIDKNSCSLNCCKHTQWPVPHIKNNNDKTNIGSNLMCNRGDGGGCVCITNKDSNYLSNRGENGRDSF